MNHNYQIKLKYIANHLSRGDAPNYVENLGIPVINQGCVWSSGLNFSKVRYHDAKYVERITAWIYKDDILMNSTGTGTLGRVCIVDKEPTTPTFTDGHVTIIRDTLGRYYPKFLFYYLSIQQESITALCSEGSTNQIELSRAKLGSFTINLPSLSEQQAIANYLDHETAKVDTLISAKERLLDLLTEKRRALITHAVTRGLNHNLPRTDSGMKLFGNIPRHWKITKLRWFVKTLEQGWSPQAEERELAEQEWGVLKLNAVKEGQFDDSKAKALPLFIDIPMDLEIRPGDFLITRGNTPDLVGDVCYVSKTRPNLILSDLIYRLRLEESKLNGKFLSFFLQSHIGRWQIVADARGSSASMVKISQEHILNWLVPVPPIEEQQAIVSYSEEKISQLDSLKIATENTIELLQERRTALITAAVTGQISIKK